MRRFKRLTAIGLSAAIVTIGLESVAPTTASAAAVSISCQGITGDNASSLGDSKATLGLLSSLSPGGGSGLTLAAEITTNAPLKTTPNAGAFNADFNLVLTLPDSLLGPARTLLNLTEVTVSNATYAISASGAASTVISKSVPSQTISLAGSPVQIAQTVSGTVTPTGSGAIIYQVAPSTQLTIAINKSVAGVQINALTVTCTGGNDIGITSVQIPGSPNVKQPIYHAGYTAAVTGRPLIGTEITPDNNNPILPDTLRVVSQAPNGGYSAVGGGAAFFLAPQETGFYVVNYDVCAASIPVPAVPGNNGVQTFTWGENYEGKGLNAHPFSMRLSFNGEKTAAIPLSEWLGQPSPTSADMADNLHKFFGNFKAPSAATIQSYLEKVPTIGKGNIKVTARTGGGYHFEFIGALALSPQPAIEVTDWDTWLPADGLTALLGMMPKPGGGGEGGGGTPTTTPLTAEQLDAALLSGSIGFDAWLDGRGKLLQADLIAGLTTPEVIAAVTAMFPKAPGVVVDNAGKATIPATETGQLCAPFQIGYFIVPNPFLVQVQAATATRTKTVTRCTYKRVKNSKGKYYTKKTCRKVTVKA